MRRRRLLFTNEMKANVNHAGRVSHRCASIGRGDSACLGRGRWAARRLGRPGTRFFLTVSVRRQQMELYERVLNFRPGSGSGAPSYELRKRFRISTSRNGVGQRAGSKQTPLGLHAISLKIGGGWPIGAVFRSRELVGFTWQGCPDAPIVHRILWLEGLEPGLNQGGDLDSRGRYIYIHGTGCEIELGRPASSGCIHLSAGDLLPLFDRIPAGTMVWIDR